MRLKMSAARRTYGRREISAAPSMAAVYGITDEIGLDMSALGSDRWCGYPFLPDRGRPGGYTPIPCGFKLTLHRKTSNWPVIGPVIGQSMVLALNFRQFGRILYMQTNLSAALCAIRVAERGVGSQPTFSLG